MVSKRIKSLGFGSVLLLTLAGVVGVGTTSLQAATSDQKCGEVVLKLQQLREKRVASCDRRAARNPLVNQAGCLATAERAYQKAVARLNCAPPVDPTDECARETDNCDPNATCVNTPESFWCACKPGYVGNGTTCRRQECRRVTVGNGVERCVEVLDEGRTVNLYLNRTDTVAWGHGYKAPYVDFWEVEHPTVRGYATVIQDDEPDINYCGPTAGRNFLSWYGLDAPYDNLGSEMKTNAWDTAPVLGAAALVCAFEPICTGILTSTIADIAVKAGSLPRYVRESLYGRMPAGYEACGTEGVDSLEDIRQSLIRGNPVVYLESRKYGNLHWAVITGLEARNGDTFLRIANSEGRL